LIRLVDLGDDVDAVGMVTSAEGEVARRFPSAFDEGVTGESIARVLDEERLDLEL
jgi:hypothetical protein